MTTPTPHAWFRPRLARLVADAQAAGIAPDVSVAVITDLVNGALAPAPAVLPDEGWNQDPGEPLGAVNGPSGTLSDAGTGDPVPNPLDRVGYRGV